VTFSFDAYLDEARSWAEIGFHEGRNNYNPFSFWQYGDYYQPWCASYVSYCAYKAGFRWKGDFGPNGERGDNNVGRMRLHAIRDGWWQPSWWRATPGAPVLLTFGVPDQHVEIVLSDEGDRILTVGGNTGDRCAFRIRYRHNVIGFVDLRKANQHASTPPVVKPRKDNDMNTLVIPSRAKAVDGRKPYFVLRPDTGEVWAYNGAKLTWDGAPTKTIDRMAAVGYPVPINGPYLGMVEDTGPIDIDGRTLYVANNDLRVVAADGGVAKANITIPAKYQH
jgi:hypothetical protein